MNDYTRILIHLGTGDEGRGRELALQKVAENVGAIGQRGPSISVLMQMIADNKISVQVKRGENET